MKKQEVSRRLCLDCGKKFTSKWKGNRICPTCKRRHTSYESYEHELNLPN